MTELELDRMIRRALLDSLRKDEEDREVEGTAGFFPSNQHLRQMQAMLQNPLKWMRNRSKPVWKVIVQKVAVILLVASLGLGSVMVVSPTVRAVVVRWVLEVYETHIVYRYFGEQPAESMQHYELTKLPEGYTETDRIETDLLGSVLYENGLGGIICFDYNYLDPGALGIYDPDDSDVINIEVNGIAGLLFVPHDPEGMLTVTWVDERANVQFCIIATHDEQEILCIAENVRLKK